MANKNSSGVWEGCFLLDDKSKRSVSGYEYISRYNSKLGCAVVKHASVLLSACLYYSIRPSYD